MISLVTIETRSLGDRSYVVHDGSVAAVIDSQRDIDRVVAIADDLGVRVSHVFETHVHNDYVTGGLELARVVGALYVLSADEDVEFDHVGVRDGDTLEVGGFVVQVVHTPGHTPHHLSFVVSDDGRPQAVFTGGSMLYGTVGRTDVQATLKAKTGAEIEPYLILGACNPQLAHQALDIERQIGLLLPCNVVVRAGDGCTIVEALDAKIIAEVPGRAELAPIAEEAGRRIRAALDALRQQP